MNFEKKLKVRFYIAVSYIVLGLIMIITFNVIQFRSEFFSPLGFAFFVIGIVRLRNHFLITKNEETIKRRQIAESDERNIAIANKAKSITFMIYIFLACICVIVLEVLQKDELSSIIGASVCILLLIYWISYFIIRKKS